MKLDMNNSLPKYADWYAININHNGSGFFKIQNWCDLTFGYRRANQEARTERWGSNYFENSFYFKNEEDAILFALRWR